jgi:hypothetical protein
MPSQDFPIEQYLQAIQQKRQADSSQGTWASALGGGIGPGMMKASDSQRKMQEDMPAQRAQLFRDMISKNALFNEQGKMLEFGDIGKVYDVYNKTGNMPAGIQMIPLESMKTSKTALFDKSRQDKGLPAFLLGDTGQYANAMPEGYKLSQMGGQGGSGIANDPQYKIYQEQENKAYQKVKDINQGIVPGNPVIAKQEYKDKVATKNNYLKSKYGVEANEYITQIEGGLNVPGLGNFGGTEVVVKEIRVKDKKSGQTGSIPENEFDPKLYDRLK